MVKPPEDSHVQLSLKVFRESALNADPADIVSDKTAVSGMRTRPRLLAAYWKSDQWKSAWGYTAALGAVTAGFSYNTVLLAQAAGDFIGTIIAAQGQGGAASGSITTSMAMLAKAAATEAVLMAGNHYLTSSLHRSWTGWLRGQLGAAFLSKGKPYYHLSQNLGTDADGKMLSPTNIDQRFADCTKDTVGGALWLTVGAARVLGTAAFAGSALWANSVAIKGLEELGSKGSFTVSVLTAAAYVVPSLAVAWKIGTVLEKANARMQDSEATARNEVNRTTHHSLQIAASGGERLQESLIAEKYGHVDGNWRRLNKIFAGFVGFQNAYNNGGKEIVSVGAALPALVWGAASVRDVMTNGMLVHSFMRACSYFIDVMPAISNFRAHSSRLLELTRAIESAQKPQELYRATGINDFRYGQQDPHFGLFVRNLDLMFMGAEKPFLHIPHLRFRPGDRVYVKAPSGTGKTCLMKALNGMWAHGRGDIIQPEGERAYISQDIVLEDATLRRLVTQEKGEYKDRYVRAVLAAAGLGIYADHLDETDHHGKKWAHKLSGGERQKLALARILLSKPVMICLDESTSNLDPASKKAYHDKLLNHCSDSIVISIMHEPDPPPFYNKVLELSEGRAIVRDLRAGRSLERRPVYAGPY